VNYAKLSELFVRVKLTWHYFLYLVDTVGQRPDVGRRGVPAASAPSEPPVRAREI
jgi:hypothetical protein